MDNKLLDPLCVDLDGTLILQDVMWVSFRNYIQKYPFNFLKPFIWLLRGRAYFKKQLAIYAPIDPNTLKYHEEFLSYLNAYKKDGGTLILATAADERFAKSVADHLSIFDDVIASKDGVNLRAHKKAEKLIQLYGEKRFTYAGNSYDDLTVWAHSKHAIGVNLSLKARFFLMFKHMEFHRIFR